MLFRTARWRRGLCAHDLRPVGIRDPNILGRVEEATRAGLNALITTAAPETFNAPVQALFEDYRLARTERALDDLQTALSERYEAMESLCTVSPDKGRQRFLPKAFRKRLPRALRPLVEEVGANVKGTVVETIEEQTSAPHAVERRRYLLGKKGVAYRLPRDFQATTGTKMTIRGTRMGGDLFPGTGPKDVRVIGNPPTQPITPAAAEENLAAILLEFPDLPHKQTPQAVAAAMNEIATYYANASYGQTQVTIQLPLVWHMATKRWGRIAGETNDAAGLACDRWAVLSEAMAAAAQEIDWSKVTVVMPVLVGTPTVPKCNEGQSGSGGAIVGRIGIKMPDGVTRTAGTSIVNDDVVTFADKPHTQIHEFTHTFGINHTGLIRCSGAALSKNVRGCAVGNSASDVMGVGSPAPTGWGIGDLNAEVKHQLGWHTSSYPAQEVTAAGSYQLSVSSRTSPGAKALFLARNSSEGLWIEYRRPEGNDVPIGNASPLQTGMRIAGRLPSLDKVWGSEVYVAPPSPFVGPSEGAAVGRTWYDPISKWAITPSAATQDSMTVNFEQLDEPVHCTPKHQIATIGNTVTFTAIEGRDPISWRNIGGPTVSGDGRTLHVIYNATGTYTVEVAMGGLSLTDRCTVEVVGQPKADLRINGSAGPSTVTPGEGVVLDWDSRSSRLCGVCFWRPDDVDGGGTCRDVPLAGSAVDVVGAEPRGYALWCGDQTVDWEWRLVNTRGPALPPTVEGNNAECVYIETRPQPVIHDEDYLWVHPGENRTVILQFRNTGTTTWAADETPHRAVMVDWPAASGLWDVTVAPLRRVTPPGEVADFAVDIHYQGSFSCETCTVMLPFNWQMSEGGVPFGQQCRSWIWPSGYGGGV